MRFFDKERVEVYVHAAKLRRDKKTGKRLWGFTLIVTLNLKLAQSCELPVAKAWQYITERESCAIDLMLDAIAPGSAIDFFAEIDAAEPALHLDGVDLAGLRLTRAANIVEFWFAGEHENNGPLHSFMKEFAFSRLWAQFACGQGELSLSTTEKKGKSK